MPKQTKKGAIPKNQLEVLKGWQQIARTCTPWSRDGHLTECQSASKVVTSRRRPEELNAWLGKESGEPAHVATDDTDLTSELKRGLSFVRSEQESRKEGVKEGQGPMESSSTAMWLPILHECVQQRYSRSFNHPRRGLLTNHDQKFLPMGNYFGLD